MKRILSFSLSVVMAFSAFSQSLWTDTFETYNVGNLGTQGGWNRDGGTASKVKIANINAAYGRSLQMATTASDEDIWVYHSINWDARTSGNDIFVAEFDVYTGTSGSEVQIYNNLFDEEYYVVGDFYFDVAEGTAHFLTQEDFDNFEDGKLLASGITSNTWYKVKYTYDFYEGTAYVTLNGTQYGPFETMPGYAPNEFDVATYGANNSGYDNIVISAVNNLAVSNVSAKAKLDIYPNPATNVIYVKSDSKIASVSIFDAAGKVVKTTTDTTINVENISKGFYIISITYVDGSKESKKVIKK